MSANDIRALENLNPIPDEQGGNAYLVNGNMIPIWAAAKGGSASKAAPDDTDSFGNADAQTDDSVMPDKAEKTDEGDDDAVQE